MFGLFNRRSRRPRRNRGSGRRAAEQMQMTFVETGSPGSMSPGPFTPRALLPAPEPSTKKAFLRQHGPRIKAMVTEAWQAATPEQRKRLSYPTCRTAAWVEYQSADPNADIETVIQEAILKCAYGRAGMGTRPSWYITGEATREDLGLERGFTDKELSKQQRAAKLRLYQEFQSQFKPVIQAAAKEAKITMKEAKAFAWRSANAGVTDPAQLERMIVRLGKVDKMASSGKISTRGMSPTMRAALAKPAGAQCTSTAGKRAALKIITQRDLKGAALQKLVDGGSADTLLYMLQASVSPASSSSPTRTRSILKALAKKGIPGAKLRGNLKKAVTSSLGAASTSPKTSSKGTSKPKASAKPKSSSKRTSKSKPKASAAVKAAFKKQMAGKATAADKALVKKHNAKVRAHKAGKGKSTARTTSSASKPRSTSRASSSKPKASAAVKAAFKKQMAGKATAADKTLVKKHNSKVRAHKAGKGKSTSRTSQAGRVAESKGVSDWALFISHWSGEVRAARVPGKKVFKVLSHAFTKLKGKDKTRAQQKPIIKKAIADYKAGKVKGAGKSLVSAAAAKAASKPKASAKPKSSSKRTSKSKPKASAAVKAAFKKQMAGKATKKDKDLVAKHNAKVRAHKAGAKSKPSTSTSRASRSKPKPSAAVSAAFKKQMKGKATAKDKAIIKKHNSKVAATVPASVTKAKARRKTGTDSYKVSGSITIKG